jgi:hypothetical protein
LRLSKSFDDINVLRWPPTWLQIGWILVVAAGIGFLVFSSSATILVNPFVYYALLAVFTACAFLMTAYMVWLYDFALPKTHLRLEQQREIQFQVNRHRPWMRVVLLVATPFFITGGLLLLSRGGVAIVHTWVSNDATKIVSVKRWPGKYEGTRKGCRGAVQVLEYDQFSNGKLCYFSSADWEQLNDGSKVKLYGKESFLGFTMFRVH